VKKMLKFNEWRGKLHFIQVVPNSDPFNPTPDIVNSKRLTVFEYKGGLAVNGAFQGPLEKTTKVTYLILNTPEGAPFGWKLKNIRTGETYTDHIINHWRISVNPQNDITYYEMFDGLVAKILAPFGFQPIEKYQTVKIRYLLGKKYNATGYPVKFFHYLTYFSGVSFWLPENTIVLKYATKELWETDKSKKWRTIMVSDLFADPDELLGMANGEKYIADILVSSFGNALSRVSDFTFGLDTVRAAQINERKRELDIYPLLGFYNTINDVVIKQNWDYVKNDLEKLGWWLLE
jgi:hypothetical protein